MAKQDQQLLTTVILAPNETPKLIGRVFDEAVTVLHAQMQRGELPTAEFQRKLAEMPFVRDDVVSRATTGQVLPNGDRLCYFTPESLDWLNVAFSAVLGNPANIGTPVDALERLQEKFRQASQAGHAPSPARSETHTKPWTDHNYLVPLTSATVCTLGYVLFGPNPQATPFYARFVAGLLVFGGIAFLCDLVSRLFRFPLWLRYLAALFNITYPLGLPVFLLYKVLYGSGQSQSNAETISGDKVTLPPALQTSANSPPEGIDRLTTPTQSDPPVPVTSLDAPPEQSTSESSVQEVTRRSELPKPVDPPKISPLEALRQRSVRDLERIATELFRSWGFEREQSWPTGDGGFELVLRRDEQRALALYYPGDDRVPLDAVQEFHGRLSNQEAARGYLLTTGYGDPEAERWAEEHAIEFVDGPTWVKRLREANLDGVV